MSLPALQKGVRLALVPAAETEFARRVRLVGSLDVPLSPRGRKSARVAVYDRLVGLGGVDAVYSAPCQGARETAEIVAAADSRHIRIVRGLEGVSLGIWEGQLEIEVEQRHARTWSQWRKDPLSVTPPGGETMAAAGDRAEKAVRSILRKHRTGTVVVVASATVIGLVYCLLEGLAPGRVFEVAGRLGPLEILGAGPDATVR